MVYLAFGLCSPLLAITLTRAVVCKLYLWNVLVGRCLHIRLLCAAEGSGGRNKDVEGGTVEGTDDDVLLALSAVCSARAGIFHKCSYMALDLDALPLYVAALLGHGRRPSRVAASDMGSSGCDDCADDSVVQFLRNK